MTSSSKSAARCLTSVIAFAALTAVTAPAADANSALAPHAASRVTLEFVKNAKDPSDSVLRVYDGKRIVNTFRAGSGLGTAADHSKGKLTKEGALHRNDCAVRKGWLPNGTYEPTSFESNRNGIIKGYAIGLPNRACHTGKHVRSALFIHSEMTKDGKQGPPKGRDSSERWEGPQDYKSEGCIKLHPDHIAWLFTHMNRHGRATSVTVR